MNRSEFIKELREALKNSVSEADVQDNVRYYAGYIDDEVKKGRSEKEVLEELGDPWLIAKTIATTPGNQTGSQEYEDVEDSFRRTSREQKEQGQRVHVFNLNSKWKVALLILAIVAIIFLVFSVLTGIISMLMPFLGLILVIVIAVKIISNRKR